MRALSVDTRLEAIAGKPVAYWDAHHIGGYTETQPADGDPIATWVNLGSGGADWDLVKGGVTAPVYSSATRSINCMSAAPRAYFKTRAAVAGWSEQTIYAVFTPQYSTVSNESVWSWRNANSTTGAFFYAPGTSSPQDCTVYLPSTGAAIQGPIKLVSGQSYVTTFVTDAARALLAMNGKTAQRLAPGAWTPITAGDNVSFYVGAGQWNGSGQYTNTQFRALAIYPTAHDDYTRTMITATLARMRAM